MKKSTKFILFGLILLFIISLIILLFIFIIGISWYSFPDNEIDYKFKIELRIDWLNYNKNPSVKIELVNKEFSENLAYVKNVNNITKSWIKYPDTLKIYCGYNFKNGKYSKLISDTLSMYIFEKEQLFEYEPSQRKFLKHEYIWQFKDRKIKIKK